MFGRERHEKKQKQNKERQKNRVAMLLVYRSAVTVAFFMTDAPSSLAGIPHYHLTNVQTFYVPTGPPVFSLFYL